MDEKLYLKHDDLESVIQVIMNEPIYEKSIWEELSFRDALRETIWMIFNPYAAARRAARGYRNVLVRRLRKLNDPSYGHH